MEKAIIKENKDKYQQTESTCPFSMHGQLRDDFGVIEAGSCTEKVLNGKYKPNPYLSSHTKDCIKVCHLPQNKPFINPFTCSFDYFKKSWNEMKEHTSSNGTHFGHYKAVTKVEDVMCLQGTPQNGGKKQQMQ